MLMTSKNPKHKNSSNEKGKNDSSKSKSVGNEKTFSSYAKKTWDFIWKDDSLASWLVNIVLAFIIIKFIVYPLLALVFGTSLPVVAVVSGSMEHEGSFDQWWESQAVCDQLQVCTQEEWYSQMNISEEQFKEFKLRNGFNKGDLILLKGIDEEHISIGDVLVYDAVGKPLPIIHRVVSISDEAVLDGKGYIFQTKGDHNPYSISNPSLDEKNVKYDFVRGKAFAKIPYVGYVKLWAVDLINAISSGSRSSPSSNI